MSRRNARNAPVPGLDPGIVADADRRLASHAGPAPAAWLGQEHADALVFLGLADVRDHAVTLTLQGHALAVAGRREIFASAAATAPLIRGVLSGIRRRGTRGCLPLDEVRALAALDGADDRQLDLALTWGEYAGLFRLRAGRVCLPVTRRWTPLPVLEFTGRLAVGAGFGALIGAERQWRARMAGLRTNALVAVGATLFVLYNVVAGTANSTQVAAYVVSGVGFLGGGVILRDGFNVRGLNTAATGCRDDAHLCTLTYRSSHRARRS